VLLLDEDLVLPVLAFTTHTPIPVSLGRTSSPDNEPGTEIVRHQQHRHLLLHNTEQLSVHVLQSCSSVQGCSETKATLSVILKDVGGLYTSFPPSGSAQLVLEYTSIFYQMKCSPWIVSARCHIALVQAHGHAALLVVQAWEGGGRVRDVIFVRSWLCF